MKIKNLNIFFIFATAIFILWGCGNRSSTSVTRQNFATQYNTVGKVLRPKYVLYNVTDSLTRLYLSVNSSDLLYTKNNSDPGYTAHILISYVIHPVDYSKIITDSGRVVLSDVGSPAVSKLLAANIDMDVIGNDRYYAEITFRDLNKMTVSYELLYLDHRGKDSRNNFLFTQDSSETPLFKNHIEAGESFRVHYYQPSVKKLYVRYYKNNYGPAPPPYAVERKNSGAAADSSWWINTSQIQKLDLPNGWYTFNTDSSSNGGAMLARFHEEFPKIILARQLVYPLRYLTMKDEYLAIDTAKNTKKAVDQFWLTSTGSQERAREVIRNFYSRVEICNTLFATQMEGWKTDRGMIYLIFGPPENVYKNIDSETWIYGNAAGPGGLTFVFDHRENAFSDEEFVLSRNADFKLNWITAVDAWRQGHVYTLR